MFDICKLSRNEAVGQATDDGIRVHRPGLFVIGEQGRDARCEECSLAVAKRKSGFSPSLSRASIRRERADPR